MQTIWQDLRHGARILVKTPGFTLIAMLTFGLGIGAVTAIFSVVDAVLLRPLPYKEPEQIALVQQHMPKLDWYYGGVSAPEMLDYIAGNETFAEMAGYGIINLNLTGSGNTQTSIRAPHVSSPQPSVWRSGRRRIRRCGVNKPRARLYTIQLNGGLV